MEEWDLREWREGGKREKERQSETEQQRDRISPLWYHTVASWSLVVVRNCSTHLARGMSRKTESEVSSVHVVGTPEPSVSTPEPVVGTPEPAAAVEEGVELRRIRRRCNMHDRSWFCL